MKILFLSFFLFSFLSAKYCAAQTTFPNIISAKSPAMSDHLVGTKLFLKLPDKYKLQNGATGYREFTKDSFTSLQIIENTVASFYQLKDEFLKEKNEIKNGDTGLNREIKIGTFDGVYYTGPFKNAGQKSIILLFGDSSFNVIIIGVFQSKDKASEAELNAFLQTINYDKSIILNPLDLVHLYFDETITCFKYSPSGPGGTDITYSVDGVIKSIEDEHHKSLFRFDTFKSFDLENSKRMLDKEIEDFSEYTITLRNVQHRYLSIDGNQAYEVIMDGKGVNISNSTFYIVLIQKEDKVIQFWSIDRDNGKWIEKFRATAQTIKFI